MNEPTIQINNLLEVDDKVNFVEAKHVLVEGTTSGVPVGQSVVVSFSDGTTTLDRTAVVREGGKWRLSSDQWADISLFDNGDISITANVSNIQGRPAPQASKVLVLDTQVSDLIAAPVQAVINQVPVVSSVSALDLARGIDVNVDLSGLTLSSGDSLRLVDATGRILAEQLNPVSHALNTLVMSNQRYSLSDGSNELFVELVDQAGNKSRTQNISLSVYTASAEVIDMSNNPNVVIRGGGGDDTVVLAVGGQDTLVFDVAAGHQSHATGGNGHDSVSGFSFVQGADRDTLVLDRLLQGYSSTGNVQLDAQTVASYLNLAQSGDDLVLSIDRDGAAGSVHGWTSLVTFVDTQLSDINGAATVDEALQFMLDSSILEIPKTPLYYLAGQSNAVALDHNYGLDGFNLRVLNKLSNAVVESTTVGATSVFPVSDFQDWYPFEDQDPLTGELFDAMLADITNVLSTNNSYLAGVLWVQGESDAVWGRDQTYKANMEQFISRLNDNFGVDYDFTMVTLSDQYSNYDSVSGWRNVRDIQLGMVDDFQNVKLIDPYEAFLNKAGYQNHDFYYDPVHYTAFAREAIMDAYLKDISMVSNTYPI